MAENQWGHPVPSYADPDVLAPGKVRDALIRERADHPERFATLPGENRMLGRDVVGDAELRNLRRRLAEGEITPEEAAEQGFPPSEPLEERR